MHQPMQAEEELITETYLETEAALWEQLAQCGWSLEEIVTFLWLRRRYQTGGSDHMELVRHWKFLKWLVRTSLREEEPVPSCVFINLIGFPLSEKLSEEREEQLWNAPTSEHEKGKV